MNQKREDAASVSPIWAVVLGLVVIAAIGFANWWLGDGRVRYLNQANEEQIREMEARKWGLTKGPDGKWVRSNIAAPPGSGGSPSSAPSKP